MPRDWTWDGLSDEGFTVTRRVRRPHLPDRVETVGTLRLPHAVGPSALLGFRVDVRDQARQWTDLVFVDVLDPRPTPTAFPTELSVEYELVPKLNGPTPKPIAPKAILLPVTTPPSQLPRLISAGIALSPYVAADDYSSTAARNARLWLEFAEKPADDEDAFFIRVLASAPDPMLTEDVVPDPREPPLPIEPEWMRVISPEQPRDDNGLRAMQRLEPTGSVHYLLPLPDGLNEVSPELLGFFVYEVRIGHSESRWCTAQGRFGPALRIAGVQHPPPPLICRASRDASQIVVRAPFATPVHEGRNLRPRRPKTQIWALLYARVEQTDGGAWRNLLIARQRFRLTGNLDRVHPTVLEGEGVFLIGDVERDLAQFGLPPATPLTVLAAELFDEERDDDPLGSDLGEARMLRVSPLATVPSAC